MTKTQTVLSLLATGTVAIGLGIFSLDGVEAQDIATVRSAKAAAEVASVTDDGVTLEELETACMAARDALVEAEKAHFEPGTPLDAVDAAVAAEATACVPMLALRKQIKADEKALDALKAVYWCKHKNRGCP